MTYGKAALCCPVIPKPWDMFCVCVRTPDPSVCLVKIQHEWLSWLSCSPSAMTALTPFNTPYPERSASYPVWWHWHAPCPGKRVWHDQSRAPRRGPSASCCQRLGLLGLGLFGHPASHSTWQRWAPTCCCTEPRVRDLAPLLGERWGSLPLCSSLPSPNFQMSVKAMAMAQPYLYPRRDAALAESCE